ncbi:MAG: ribosome-associated translation inhibitor RaiA [Planctomycetes bacterium]|nr:ribosome-associated translation inhibitor RaiA [Planctomycetota bacterium]
MKITVTGRHMVVTDRLRDFSIEKTSRLLKYFDNLQRAEIVFIPEKDGRYAAEVIVHAPRGSVLVVHAKDPSATAAFDTALAKLERQLVKLKDKLRKESRRTVHGAAFRSAGITTGGEEAEPSEAEIIGTWNEQGRDEQP